MFSGRDHFRGTSTLHCIQPTWAAAAWAACLIFWSPPSLAQSPCPNEHLIFSSRFDAIADQRSSNCRVRHRISGRAFKGPVAEDTSVELQWLNESLTPTDQPTQTTQVNGAGVFALNTLTIDAPGLFTAQGVFFNELTNARSQTPITLQAITQIGGTHNIHVLSTLEIPRVRALVGQGLSLSQAKAQAVSEWLALLGQSSKVSDATAIDLSGEHADALLALSAAILTDIDGTPRSVVAIQALTDNWAQDFENGDLSPSNQAQLAGSVQAAQPLAQTIVTHLSQHLSGQGLSGLNLNLDATLDGMWVTNTHEITLDVTGLGQVSPSEPARVIPGESITFTWAASFGHQLDTVTGDCPRVVNQETNTIVVTPTEDCALNVSFTLKRYAITVEVADGGMVQPPGPIEVSHGQDLSLIITPPAGFDGIEANGCGGVLSQSTYAIKAIQASCTVKIDFFKYFYLDDNGITIRCPQAQLGEVGEVAGITYTKRDRTTLSPVNAETSCISGVSDLSGVFKNDETFNGDISHWDVSEVTTMVELFYGASDFNQDISAWDTQNVSDMEYMFFKAATFNQDLSQWCVAQIPTRPFGFSTGANAWASANQPQFGVPCEK